MNCVCPTGELSATCGAHVVLLGRRRVLVVVGPSLDATGAIEARVRMPVEDLGSIVAWVSPLARRPRPAPPPHAERVRKIHNEGARFGWADAPRRPCYRAVRAR